jgi:hypothetical protein
VLHDLNRSCKVKQTTAFGWQCVPAWAGYAVGQTANPQMILDRCAVWQLQQVCANPADVYILEASRIWSSAHFTSILMTHIQADDRSWHKSVFVHPSLL